MSEKQTIFANGLLLMAFMLVLGFIIGRNCPQETPVGPIKTKVDTLVVYDTITQIQPISVEKRVVERQLVQISDTLRIRDTMFVYMNREQVIWRDSLSAVYASGIMPQVDSVKHFVQDRFITIETQVPVKIRSRWGLGLQAGMGAGKDGITPYVGVGLSYNLLSW